MSIELNRACYGAMSASAFKGSKDYTVLDISNYNVTHGMRNIGDIGKQLFKGSSGVIMYKGSPVPFDIRALDVQSQNTYYMGYDFIEDQKIISEKKGIEPVAVESALTRDYTARVFKDSLVFGTSSKFYSFAPKFIGSERRLPIPIFSNVFNISTRDVDFNDVTLMCISSITNMCMGNNKRTMEANFNNDLSTSISGEAARHLPRTIRGRTSVDFVNMMQYNVCKKFVPVFWPEHMKGLTEGNMKMAILQDMDVHDLLLLRFPYDYVNHCDSNFTDIIFEKFKAKLPEKHLAVEAVRKYFIEIGEDDNNAVFNLGASDYPGAGSQAMYEVYVDLLCQSIAQLLV